MYKYIQEYILRLATKLVNNLVHVSITLRLRMYSSKIRAEGKGLVLKRSFEFFAVGLNYR